MISNYLQERYPEEGYKRPMQSPTNYHFLSKDYGKNKDEIDLYNSIPKHKCTNVCECGEEWEDRYAQYQEGCYPYLAKVCRECNVKHEIETNKKNNELLHIQRIKDFEESLPPRFRGKLTEPNHRELLTSTCSIIWGGFGTGKTWESYSVAKELISNGDIKSYKLTTEIDLLNDLKSDIHSVDRKIERYKNYDLLIVDESGKNNDSDFNKVQLFGILNYRYEWEKKTILICNAKNKEEIKNLLPTATLDRYRECVIEMNGKSRRYNG